jgi:hypothetical protein
MSMAYSTVLPTDSHCQKHQNGCGYWDVRDPIVRKLMKEDNKMLSLAECRWAGEASCRSRSPKWDMTDERKRALEEERS